MLNKKYIVIHMFLATQGVVSTKCPVLRSICDSNIQYFATCQLVLTVHQSYTLVYSLATKTLQEQCSFKKRLQIKQTSKALLQSQSPSQMKYRPHCSDFPLSQKLAFFTQNTVHLGSSDLHVKYRTQKVQQTRSSKLQESNFLFRLPSDDVHTDWPHCSDSPPPGRHRSWLLLHI